MPRWMDCKHNRVSIIIVVVIASQRAYHHGGVDVQFEFHRLVLEDNTARLHRCDHRELSRRRKQISLQEIFQIADTNIFVFEASLEMMSQEGGAQEALQLTIGRVEIVVWPRWHVRGIDATHVVEALVREQRRYGRRPILGG